MSTTKNSHKNQIVAILHSLRSSLENTDGYVTTYFGPLHVSVCRRVVLNAETLSNEEFEKFKHYFLEEAQTLLNVAQSIQNKGKWNIDEHYFKPLPEYTPEESVQQAVGSFIIDCTISKDPEFKEALATFKSKLKNSDLEFLRTYVAVKINLLNKFNPETKSYGAPKLVVTRLDGAQLTASVDFAVQEGPSLIIHKKNKIEWQKHMTEELLTVINRKIGHVVRLMQDGKLSD